MENKERPIKQVSKLEMFITDATKDESIIKFGDPYIPSKDKALASVVSIQMNDSVTRLA